MSLASLNVWSQTDEKPPECQLSCNLGPAPLLRPLVAFKCPPSSYPPPPTHFFFSKGLAAVQRFYLAFFRTCATDADLTHRCPHTVRSRNEDKKIYCLRCTAKWLVLCVIIILIYVENMSVVLCCVYLALGTQQIHELVQVFAVSKFKDDRLHIFLCSVSKAIP